MSNNNFVHICVKHLEWLILDLLYICSGFFLKKNRNFLVGFVIIKINLHPEHVSDMSCLKD